MAVHSKLAGWERRLHEVLQEVDARLEEAYGGRWDLHPARPARGSTANSQYDGLFRVTASFSAGYGSELGRGYVFRVELVTLENVPPEARRQIEDRAVRELRRGLKDAFPGQRLLVTRDGPVFKIHGDLGLGRAY